MKITKKKKPVKSENVLTLGNVMYLGSKSWTLR